MGEIWSEEIPSGDYRQKQKNKPKKPKVSERKKAFPRTFDWRRVLIDPKKRQALKEEIPLSTSDVPEESATKIPESNEQKTDGKNRAIFAVAVFVVGALVVVPKLFTAGA